MVIMKEIRPLTSLRAFAAFLVFMYHYAWMFPPASRGAENFGEWIPFLGIWRQGQVGVSIFFVLSGFLITRIYFDQIAQGKASLRLFFVKRVARIWPLFLVFALVQHLVQTVRGESLDTTALVTMTMSQAFFKGLRYSGLPTAWSLTIEESFYALAPILFLALAAVLAWTRREDDTRLNGWRIAGLALFLGGAIVVLAGLGEAITRFIVAMGWNWEGFFATRHHVLHSTIFGRFPEFTIGVMAAFIHRGTDLSTRLRGWRATALLLGSFGGIAALLAVRSLMDQGTFQGGELWYYVLAFGVAILSGVLILALSVDGGPIHRFLGARIFVYLGKISYGFYLIQLSVLIEPMVYLSDRLGFVRLPVLLILVNLFCALVYQLVEAPTRRAIVTRWGGQIKSTPPHS